MNTPTRLRSVLVSALALVLGLVAFSAIAAPLPPDLSGTWSFETSLSLAGLEGPPCVFEGTAEIEQSGVQLTGTATMKLVGVGASCPSEAMADVSGTVNGPSIFLQLDGGVPFGVADLTGEDLGGPGYVGSVSVETGPYPSSGSWSALRSAAPSIPTVGVVGAAVLTLLLASVSLVVMRMRSSS